MIDYIKQFIAGNNEKERDEFCVWLEEKIKELKPGDSFNEYTDYNSSGKLYELIKAYNTVKGTGIYIKVGYNKCGLIIEKVSENIIKVSVKRGYGLNWEDKQFQYEN